MDQRGDAFKGGGEAFAIEAGTAGSAIISMIYKLPDLI